VATEPQVFFNYRRSDSGLRAERLCDALRWAFGPEQVFKDTDTIGSGSDFAVAIDDALARAELVIAVIGPTWLTVVDEKGERRLDDPDDYVRRELETALDRAVPIIPVLLEGAGAPNREELPESLRGLVAHQAFVLRDEGWFDRVGGPLIESARTLAAVERERRERASAGLGVGASFGPFRLDELLEEDSTGARYRAYDSEQHRTVAVQILAPGPSADPSFREEFLGLAATTAEIDEPHIVPVLSHGEHDGRLFVAVALAADGVPLPTAIAVGGVFADEVAVDAVEDIAKALDALHAHGIAGVDLWPSDILRARRGTEIITLLLPFGVFRPGDRPTQAGRVEYAAPERLLGDAVDQRSDVYVLACMLVEGLTAEPPYGPADDPAAMIAGHLKGPIPRPTDLYSGIPAAMDKVVRRGMAKKPDRRYPTAGALAAAARAALSAAPTTVERTAAPRHASSPRTPPPTVPGVPAGRAPATAAPTTPPEPATNASPRPAAGSATAPTPTPTPAPTAGSPSSPTTTPPSGGAQGGPPGPVPSYRQRIAADVDEFLRQPAMQLFGRWPTAPLWLAVGLGLLALGVSWVVGALWLTGIAGKKMGDPFAVDGGQILLGLAVFPFLVAFVTAFSAACGVGASVGFDRFRARRTGRAAPAAEGDVTEIAIGGACFGFVLFGQATPLASLARAVERGQVPASDDGNWLLGLGGTAVVVLLYWLALSCGIVLAGRSVRGKRRITDI
jgi:serine/threonine protein kinase